MKSPYSLADSLLRCKAHYIRNPLCLAQTIKYIGSGELAQKIAALVVGADGHVYDYYPFAFLFGNLNTDSQNAAASVLEVLLGLFKHEAAQAWPDSLFFEFNVGGSAGTAYASAINKLSYSAALTSDAKLDILTKYPSLLLNNGEICFSANDLIVSSVLKALITKVQAGDLPSPVVSDYTLKTLSEQRQGKYFGSCTKNLVTDEVKALALELGGIL